MKNKRPDNYVVHTVTGKEITLNVGETNTLYSLVDMGMDESFINTWLYDIVCMHNADDRMKIESVSPDYVPSEKERRRDLIKLLVNILLIAIILSGLFFLIVTL